MGKAAFTMGLFGITEGAIPFAAQDPLRVIPSIMAGSMTGSVIAMIGNVETEWRTADLSLQCSVQLIMY